MKTHHWELAKQQTGKLAAGIGLFIAFLSALDVTLGTAQKANLHRDLYRRYVRLDGEIASQGLEADIEADEPLQRLMLAFV